MHRVAWDSKQGERGGERGESKFVSKEQEPRYLGRLTIEF